MEARRTEKISTVLIPELAARLNDFASRNRWSLSTAIAVLIEEGLDDYEASVAAEHSAEHAHRLMVMRTEQMLREPQKIELGSKVLFNHGMIDEKEDIR